MPQPRTPNEETYWLMTTMAEMALVWKRDQVESFLRNVQASHGTPIAEAYLRERGGWDRVMRIEALATAFAAFHQAAREWQASGKKKEA